MCATHYNNIRPIYLEIKQRIPRDSTKKAADLQEKMLAFGIVYYRLIQKE